MLLHATFCAKCIPVQILRMCGSGSSRSASRMLNALFVSPLFYSSLLNAVRFI